MKKSYNHNLTIFSWSSYDFANQPFTTIILTFIYSRFFVQFITPDGIDGTLIWTRTIALSAILVALLSPIMGALADRGGYRKIFLIFWTWVCIIFSFLLYYPIKGDVYFAAMLFCIANVGFEMGGVFLNAYLPEIASQKKIGRISGYGWSFGYAGGLIALIICYQLFVVSGGPFENILDKDTGQHIRVINIFVAIWFAIFSIPTFLFVKEKSKQEKITFNIIKESYNQLIKTFISIQKYKQTLRFLLARIIYNDAIITIFALGSIYAAEVFSFDENKIFLFGIILNITAGIGAFTFGFLDDIIGGKRTIQLTNIGFVIACLLAVLAPIISSQYVMFGMKSSEFLFWISGCLIGVFSGPNQAASRSLMGRLTPKNKENEFYGFFAFSGKATAFVGPLLYGTIKQLTGKHEYGLLVVALLFLIGFVLLSFVNEQEGIEFSKNESIT